MARGCPLKFLALGCSHLAVTVTWLVGPPPGLRGFSWVGHDSQLGEAPYRLGPGPALELLETAVDVHLHGARADEQGAADLPAGVAVSYQPHDVEFAAGQAHGARGH